MSDSEYRSIPVLSRTFERWVFEKDWGDDEKKTHTQFANEVLDDRGTPSEREMQEKPHHELIIEMLDERRNRPD